MEEAVIPPPLARLGYNTRRSPDHERELPQAKLMHQPILGFDVGNSSIKAAVMRPFQAIDASLATHALIGPFEGWIDQLLERVPTTSAVIATVNPPRSDELIAALRRRSVRDIRVLRSDGELLSSGLIEHELVTPETTGIDRVLCVIGAVERARDRAVLVVTCGSAVTINLASERGVFLGGAILPGFRLTASSLHRGTAALPHVPLTKPASALGGSTDTAIASGVYHCVAGGVDRILRELSRGRQVEIYLTGGDADLLRTGLDAVTTVIPHLLFEGLDWVIRQRSF